MTRLPRGVLYRTDVDAPTAIPPTPEVLRQAELLGIDPESVPGGGVGGRVRLQDLAHPGRRGLAPPQVPERAVAVAELDVSGLRRRYGSDLDLRATITAALLEAAPEAEIPVATLSVAVPGSDGRMRTVVVPRATDLSVAGLARGIRAATAEPEAHGDSPAPDPAPGDRSAGGIGLTVLDSGADGFLLELPVVETTASVLVSIGAPQSRVVPGPGDGPLAVSVGHVVQLVVASEPSRVSRAAVAALVGGLRRRLEV